MHRTTLPKDVEVLRAAGVEVMSERKRTMYYYLSDRPLSLPELRLLIDAVLSSKFITEKKSQELVDKLISLTSETSADKLQRTVRVTGKAKSDNEKGYYIVDAIPWRTTAMSAATTTRSAMTPKPGSRASISSGRERPMRASSLTKDGSENGRPRAVSTSALSASRSPRAMTVWSSACATPAWTGMQASTFSTSTTLTRSSSA